MLGVNYVSSFMSYANEITSEFHKDKREKYLQSGQF